MQRYKKFLIWYKSPVLFIKNLTIDSPKARKGRGSSLAGSPSYALSLYASTISIAPLKARREP